MTHTLVNPSTLWSGRIDGKSDPLFRQFNDSLAFDWRLASHDIAASIAWARALGDAGVLSEQETAALVEALEELTREVDAASADPHVWRELGKGHEDIHSWVEAKLVARLGALGKKLHTGRSRNDQVATDLRLYTREQSTHRVNELRAAQGALVRLAQREHNVVFPGYTHLQRAQPILFAHWCLAYFQMLQRDADRFIAASIRASFCPLGSGALSGTAYPIDRMKLAASLGFDAPTPNSLDAVSDRDFVIEALSCASMTALHLSRLAEDLIIYSTSEFGLIELPDAFTSGSSLMPQKKNPDALELIRGKCGRIVGALMGLCMTLKGLPLAYNKDLQEDKEPLFDAMDQLSLCLGVLPPLLDGIRVNRQAANLAAQSGFSNATDLADHLVSQGMPFREAHHAAGRLVRQAMASNRRLDDLSLEEIRAAAPLTGPEVYVRLTIDSVLSRRDVEGGTAPKRVEQALQQAARFEELANADKPMARRPARQAAKLSIDVRQARIDDLDAICNLVDYWARQGENLPRSREAILEAIADFGVATLGGQDGKVIGCGSLTIYTPALAEIRSLGVDPKYQGAGAGAHLVRHFIAQASHLHIPKVFVLTRVPPFFQKLGFSIVDIASFPEKIRKDCNQCPKREKCDEIAMVHEVAPGVEH
jgi:argininosuccinate lyase/amino-acid N-acetyltransferase